MLEDSRQLVARDEADTSQIESTLTAQAIADLTWRLPSQARDIIEETQVHRFHQRIATPLGERVRTALTWGSIPLKHGIRMGAAALTGEAIAHAIDLPHGSWVAATSMMLLRPDIGPTVPRIVMRALGTTAGALLVIVVAIVCGNDTLLLIIATSVAVIVMFALIQVSYSFTSGLLATTVLLLMSLDDNDTFDLAFARWVDVLVGCVVGTIFALAIPLWKRTSLRTDAAGYAEAVSSWFSVIAAYAQLEPGPERDNATDAAVAAGKRCRERAAQRVGSTLAISLLEPPTAKEMNPAIIGNLMAAIGECSEGAIAALGPAAAWCR